MQFAKQNKNLQLPDTFKRIHLREIRIKKKIKNDTNNVGNN